MLFIVWEKLGISQQNKSEIIILANKNDILNAAASGIEWLESQEPATVKDISRSIQALSLWDRDASDLIEILLSGKKGSFWETDKPVPDTSRACSALAGCGNIQSDALDWILSQQTNCSWNDNEIDTSYALIALGDCGTKNTAGCDWLIGNYGTKWEHTGTTSLIITALLKQNGNNYRHFINDRARWILPKRSSGGWTYVATSNLAIQALILACKLDFEKRIGPSIQWLLEKQKGNNWGDITSTSLSLISLKMYLDKLNSDWGNEVAKSR